MTKEKAIEWLNNLTETMKAETSGNYSDPEYRDEVYEALDMAIKALEQEPKTGHWIWCVGAHKCSNCEEYTCFSHKNLLRYCPNCGAKMIEPQERS